MRNPVVLILLFALLVSGAVPSFAAEVPPTGGIAAMMELLQKKGLVSAEEAAALRERSAGEGPGAELKAVLELLREKGVVSEDEAETALKAASRPAHPAGVAVPVAESTLGISETDADMLRAKLNLIFVKQGILGEMEAEQISERIGVKWTPDPEDDVIADPDAEIEYHKTTLPVEGLSADIDHLVRQGILTGEESERVKARLKKKLALERVTDGIDSDLRAQLDKQVKERIVPIPSWVARIKLGGDFRLRYQSDFFDGSGGGFDSGNGIFVKPDKPTELYNSTVDRQQLRIRARLSLISKVTDQVEVGMGLATGNTTNPVSTNATLGDSLNKKAFQLDQAYLKWSPLKSLTLWGGRFPSPWYGSDLVWDPDVNFDGITFAYRPQLTPVLDMFLTGGAFPIQEVEISGKDKWLYGGQLGIQYKDQERMTGNLAVAFYHFEHTLGQANSPNAAPGATDWTAPQFQQKGNTLFDIDPSTAIKTAYASEFQELNVGASLDLGFWDPIRVVLMADYVYNLGFNGDLVNTLTGADVRRENEGYQVGVSVGHPDTRNEGLWRAYVNYKRLEADAVMDAFTESDFHLGGTNAKGWILGGDLGLASNVWCSARWLTTNEISGPPLAIDVLQVNLNAKF